MPVELQNLLAAVSKSIELHGEQTYLSTGAVLEDIKKGDHSHAEHLRAQGVVVKPLAFKGQVMDALRKGFGVRDRAAEIVIDDKGNAIADSDLRDAEYIPYSVIGDDLPSGIEAYFDAEVKPHWPDAWINWGVKDKADGQCGIVGCEINFNREFYVYEAPRSREEIKRDIEAMEKRFMEMLKGVAA